jgi:hypothetical protein
MNQNTIPRTRRQTTMNRAGEALERGYIYLPSEKWTALYAAAKASGMSASLYLESLIPAVSGTYQVKENHVSTQPCRIEQRK